MQNLLFILFCCRISLSCRILQPVFISLAMIDKRKLYYLMGPQLRRWARRVYYYPADLRDTLSGRRDPMIPPRGRVFIGYGDFRQQGERLMQQLIDYAGLKPYHRVLDIGCGIGRLAVPLTGYLNDEGSYEGFDIVRSAIQWCKKKISSAHPRFQFRHIHLRNDLYNLQTRNKASHFAFPYESGQFDVVFLFSVFTHMLPEDVENYLGEIARVLKPGGRCLSTFFVMNEETKQRMDAFEGLKFVHDKGDYLLMDPKVKEANVAYREKPLLQSIHNQGLKLESIHYGYWSGRKKEDCVDFQDVLIFSTQS